MAQVVGSYKKLVPLTFLMQFHTCTHEKSPKGVD